MRVGLEEVVKGQHEESFSDGNILYHSCIDVTVLLYYITVLQDVSHWGTWLKVTWDLSVLFITTHVNLQLFKIKSLVK